MEDPTLGCTAFPEGEWHDCCVQHDLAYRNLDTSVWNWRAKRQADVALYRCARAKGHPHVAVILFLGVRLFGLPAWVMDRWRKKEK